MKIALLMDQLAPGSALKLLSYPFQTIPNDGHELDALIIKRSETPKSQLELLNNIPKINLFYLEDYYPKFLKHFDVKIPGLTFFGFYHLYSYFFAGYAVSKINKKYDVIVAYCQYTSFAAKSISRFSKSKFFILAWDPSDFTLKKIYSDKFKNLMWLLRPIAKIYDWFAFFGSAGVINSCHFHNEAFRGVTKSPIHILSPGCTPNDSPFDREKTRDLVTWDRWDYGNNPVKMLKILALLKDKSIKLAIGGYWHTNQLRSEFIAQSEQMGLIDRIELLPELSESEIASLCLSAKLHMHPIHEAFGMQVLEASAVGCPSIIVQGSGAAELYEHRVSGLHPMDNIESFAAEIDWAFADDGRLRELSYAAYKVAIKHSWVNHSKKLVKICKSAFL